MKEKMRRMLCGKNDLCKDSTELPTTHYYESKLNDFIEFERFSVYICFSFSVFFFFLLTAFIFFSVKNPLTIFMSLSLVAGVVIISWLLHTTLNKRIAKIRKMIDMLTGKMK